MSPENHQSVGSPHQGLESCSERPREGCEYPDKDIGLRSGDNGELLKVCEQEGESRATVRKTQG